MLVEVLEVLMEYQIALQDLDVSLARHHVNLEEHQLSS
jgi:hypothetical protein